jgi:hypothetical protein
MQTLAVGRALSLAQRSTGAPQQISGGDDISKVVNVDFDTITAWQTCVARNCACRPTPKVCCELFIGRFLYAAGYTSIHDVAFAPKL